MTATLTRPVLRARFAWHRPLLWLALAMAVLTVVALVGLAVDQRTLTGMPLWAKPLKFSFSVGVYSLTLAWLLGLLARGRRFAWWIGTVAAVFLAVEMVIIFWAAAADTTSHFNVSTPLAAAVWGTMAVSIVIVWVATIVVAVLLFRADLGDPARSFAIRSAVVIAVVGMGLAFLMTGPQADQLSDYRGIVGAHSVGIADGGPGLPLLGWSTVGGDLRIPHFVGMHALQVIPIAALLLELASRRVARLRSSRARLGILAVFAALYVGVLAVLTVQALAGESIVHPDAAVATVTTLLFAASAMAIVVVLRRPVADGIS